MIIHCSPSDGEIQIVYKPPSTELNRMSLDQFNAQSLNYRFFCFVLQGEQGEQGAQGPKGLPGDVVDESGDLTGEKQYMNITHQNKTTMTETNRHLTGEKQYMKITHQNKTTMTGTNRLDW